MNANGNAFAANGILRDGNIVGIARNLNLSNRRIGNGF
jgi:hypothetical protein